MGVRGTSKLVALLCLCGACNVYHGDSAKQQGQREQPAIAAPDPREFRNAELIGIRFPSSAIDIQLRNVNASNTERQKPEQPESAGARAPNEKEPPDMERSPREEMGDADDAGVMLAPAVADAGAREAQKIETGRPDEVDAGKPRIAAKTSKTCRGERGFETDGRCYFMLETPVSWNVGRDHCYEHDAHLASVTSEEESDFIASFDLEHDVWIGFSRFGAANFSWLTTESGSFSNWQEGSPRPMQESGALIKASTGLWTNRAVSELHASLCETERRSR